MRILSQDRDPRSHNNVKRALGALRSRHPAAFLAMATMSLRPFFTVVDSAVSQVTGKQAGLPQSNLRCAFLVCPPRSGGTIIYQTLTCALPSVYLSNAHALFPWAATKLLRRRRHRLHAHQSFNNYYGYTSDLCDVYEGNEFFEWLHQSGAEMYDERQQTQEVRSGFERLLQMLAPLASECVILKNARSYSTVLKLHRAVPEIVFVRVRRDRSQVVESVVRAYRELGSFHPVPGCLQDRPVHDPIEFACAQIEAIEANLDEQFSSLPPSARFEVSYEDYCQQPLRFIEPLAYDFLNLPPGAIRECPALTRLSPSRRHKVTDAEGERIRLILERHTTKDACDG